MYKLANGRGLKRAQKFAVLKVQEELKKEAAETESLSVPTEADFVPPSDFDFVQPEECYEQRKINAPFFDEDIHNDWESLCGDCNSDSTEITFLSPESSPIRCCRWIVAHSPHRIQDSPLGEELPEASSSFQRFRSTDGINLDRKRPNCIGSAALRRLSEVSAAFSEQSSSIRLQWDDPSWETHSDMTTQGVTRRCQSLSPSDVSEFSEFRAARKLFDDFTTLSFEDQFGVDEGYMDATPTGEESFGSISEAHEFIERNCMTDSKHLYHIVSGCSPGSGSISVCSNLTTQSFHSLRHYASSAKFSNGLLDLTHSSTSSTSATDYFSNSMTDSAISRGSASSGDERLFGMCSSETAEELDSKSYDSGNIASCAEEGEVSCIVRKRVENRSKYDRRFMIVRRADLYDSHLAPTCNLKRNFKRFEICDGLLGEVNSYGGAPAENPSNVRDTVQLELLIN